MCSFPLITLRELYPPKNLGSRLSSDYDIPVSYCGWGYEQLGPNHCFAWPARGLSSSSGTPRCLSHFARKCKYKHSIITRSTLRKCQNVEMASLRINGQWPIREGNKETKNRLQNNKGCQSILNLIFQHSFVWFVWHLLCSEKAQSILLNLSLFYSVL